MLASSLKAKRRQQLGLNMKRVQAWLGQKKVLKSVNLLETFPNLKKRRSQVSAVQILTEFS